LSITKGGSTYYYSQDGLGSVRTLTDASGAVVNSYDYLAFGGAYSPTAKVSLPQRYTYTGRELNPTSDLMYYRYRTYDPRVGRFAARDPIRLLTEGGDVSGPLASDGEHVYAYVDGLVVQKRDALGLWASSGHKDLTRRACKEVGLCSEKCCEELVKANVGTDGTIRDAIRWYGGEDSAHPEQHSMVSGGRIGTMGPDEDRAARLAAKQANAKYVKDQKKSGAQAMKKGQCHKGLSEFGMGLHALQDSFAHIGLRKTDKPIGFANYDLPITDHEHRQSFTYDNATEHAGRYAKAYAATVGYVKFVKQSSGCCCSQPRVDGQPEDCEDLCE